MINHMPSRRAKLVADNRSHALDLFEPLAEPEQIVLSRDSNVVVRTVRIGKHKGVTNLPNAIQSVGSISLDLAGLFDKAWLTSPTRHKSMDNGPRIRTVDLFAGCGGLSMGVQEAVSALGGKFESVFASDIDKGALSVYSANLSPEILSASPIHESLGFDLSAGLSRKERLLQEQCKQSDFLIGGPPCQGHSDLNNHTRRDDPRNELYGVMGRAASVFRPRYIIIENVIGVRHSSTGVVQRTMEHLNRLGYKTASIMLNAASFGVAQNRKRHFTLAMVGSPERFHRTLTMLQRAERPVMWAIDDLMDETDLSDEIFRTAATHSATNKKRIEFLFANELYELPDSQRPDCHRLKSHTYNSVYGRMRPESPSPTITSGFGSTGQGRFVHPYKRRTLTPHEAARIQFFPDWFTFQNLGRRQLQKYIGNAVPPKLGYVLALISTEIEL
jgi:DNA (cytosine-5)-methyltransferase 1